ncbi:G5 domain-containing protein [Bacillus sp. JJ1533]|uniref:G5 domain-containing protein n=1 Tax=Bacillus sp. JJ1533 TaxID=3122959 RepID=UPI0030003994
MFKKGIILLLTLILLLVLVSCGLADSQSSKEENVEETLIADKEKENVKDVRKEGNKLENADIDSEQEGDTRETTTEKEVDTKTENYDSSKDTYKESTESTPTVTVKVEKKIENKSTSTSTPAPKKDSITTKTTTATESIPFQTVTQNDANLEKGKTVVVQNGSNGTKTITYKEVYTNGKLTSKDVVSSTVTKQPTNKIVKVGTKVVQAAPTYQSASKAHSILSGSGVLSKNGNTYTISDGFGYMVKVEVGSSHVDSISFNGTTYYAWKHTSKADLVSALGEEEGTREYNAIQNEIRNVESAVRAAANAVYGSGTASANSLYSQILNNATSGFYKTF